MRRFVAIVFVPVTLIAAAPSLDVGVALPTFVWFAAANIALVRSRRLAGVSQGSREVS